MTPLLINFALAFIFIAFTSNLVIAIAYPLYKKLLLKKTSLQHSNLIFSYSLLPFFIAGIGSIAINIQHNVFTPIFEHCHHNNCQAHTPQIDMSNTGSQLIALLFICLTASSLIVILSKNKYLNKRLAQLQLFSKNNTDENYHILSTEKISALSTGLLKPKIYISEGMIKLLSTEEVDSVIRHEQAHCINKDNLRKNIIYWLSIVWPKPLKKMIRQDFSLHCEYSSDFYASQSLNEKKILVKAIEKINTIKPSNVYQQRIHQLKKGFSPINKIQQILFFSIFSYCLLLVSLSCYHYIAELILN